MDVSVMQLNLSSNIIYIFTIPTCNRITKLRSLHEKQKMFSVYANWSFYCRLRILCSTISDDEN